ncbi:nitroreductase/quinone reductase family protein [Salinibacterium soli]|uniref:Nitroreductase/quinone reductase family protein n=1 Tax=Antiquaquibacter soli TaxID=3064523 RepID=A0ABT9BP38_9MICO|nr:nitroreductase/quinone reductase family protein [Protaetiibacter sp. WY-16]MDO7882770.1 nitroreductase/quinone reductase family protein [Protaetiibacter sp. WY-16]
MSANDVVIAILRGPAHWMLGSRLTALRVTGTVSGAVHEFPVDYRRVGPTTIEVVPGAPETKKWWRNLRTAAPVQVLLRREWVPGVGVVVDRHGHPVVVIELGDQYRVAT